MLLLINLCNLKCSVPDFLEIQIVFILWYVNYSIGSKITNEFTDEKNILNFFYQLQSIGIALINFAI